MSTFIVYQASSDAAFETMERHPGESTHDINLRIAQKSGLEFGHLNWFHASEEATTPESAKKEARASGFKYTSPERRHHLFKSDAERREFRRQKFREAEKNRLKPSGFRQPAGFNF